MNVTGTQMQDHTERLVIWIVEDDDHFGKQLSELINLSSMFVCEKVFRACEPMLESLSEDVPPDILLMDIGLPGMSGIEGVRKAKTIAPAVQVVILTVFADTENIVQSISAGASGYLHKGSSLETIVESLKSILAGGAPINPQIAKTILEVFAHLSPPTNDYGLTPREKEVLTLLIDGLPKKQIADRLFVTFHTIDKHLRNIYGKLQVQSRSSAVAKVLKEHIL
jgi:DNA-binding NarL/FixJ family response regulator